MEKKYDIIIRICKILRYVSLVPSLLSILSFIYVFFAGTDIAFETVHGFEAVSLLFGIEILMFYLVYIIAIAVIIVTSILILVFKKKKKALLNE